MAAAERVQDYLATLAAESEEVRFLRSVPWTHGTHLGKAAPTSSKDFAPKYAALLNCRSRRCSP